MVHVYNCTPIQRLKWSTPYKSLTRHKPNVSDLQVLGCAAYVFLPPETWKNKLQPKAKLMIFLGFEPGMKGFKFICIMSNTIFMGATAVFNQNYFLKCKDQTIPMTEQSDLSGDMGNK